MEGNSTNQTTLCSVFLWSIRQKCAYDLLNREIRRIERDGGVQRTIYDRNGQVVRLIRPNEYDAQTDSGDGFQFTYDAQGRVLTVLSPNVSIAGVICTSCS